MPESTEPEPTGPDPTRPEPTNISDRLKQTIDDLEIDRHVDDLVVGLEGLFASARDAVATLAHERGGDVERLLDQVSTTIDERTDGRYAGELSKVRSTVTTGVSRLAEQRPGERPAAKHARSGEDQDGQDRTEQDPTAPRMVDETSIWPVDQIEPPHAE